MLATVFVASRLLCLASGIRFDMHPLGVYWQYIDPVLLKNDFWRSLFYLEHQPPVFNFFLGAMLHLLPSHPEIGFQIVFLCLGLILSLSLFELMDRMGVDRRIALTIALLFTISPSTILYENLLFYEYPLTVLFAVAALFLHRFATEGKIADGLVFFSSAALIAGIRSFYNVFWFALLIIIAAIVLRGWKRQIVRAAAIPALFVGAIYAQHFIVFHTLIHGGRAFTALNLSSVIADPVPEDVLDRLIAEKKITPILETDMFELGDDFDVDPSESEIAKIVPVPPKTGIPVRDDCVKSTLAFNWNCVWAANVGDVYNRDSLVVFRNYPRYYFESLANNFARYFLPDTEDWPWDGRTQEPNQRVLSPLLAIYNLFTSGEWPPIVKLPWLAYIALPALLGFGLFQVFNKARPIALRLVIAFMLGNIFYVSTIVILLAAADQNRYRSEMSAYFAVLLALAIDSAYRAGKRPQPKNDA